ncbi:MFS transporter [Pseudomonas amygdali]|nr:MFS transporter [Pseudomonas amygdali]
MIGKTISSRERKIAGCAITLRRGLQTLNVGNDPDDQKCGMIMAEKYNQPSFLSVFLLGLAQILSWGGSFFVMAVLVTPIVEDTGWARQWVYGALSISILLSGLLSPWMGKLISQHGGRRVLASSGLVLSVGLFAAGMATNIVVFVIAWLVIGLGMAIGLYDALFATLGKTYGAQSRAAISKITLISGFATTISWPVVAWLVQAWGWRSACEIFALVLAVTVAPLYLISIPRDSAPRDNVKHVQKASSFLDGQRSVFRVMTAAFTLAAIIMTAVSIQLISLLQAQGVGLTAAIGIAALIGPAQVGARLLDGFFGKELHPIWPTIASAVLVAIGLAFVLASPLLATIGILVYGTGSGMRAIVRGTLPMALFDKDIYPVVIGKIARPALMAQAITPLVGGWIQGRWGAGFTLEVLFLLAVINVVLVIVLFYKARAVFA